MTRAKLVLIDGNSIVYRAFFALPALSNARGQFTNAVFGFTQMLLKILHDERPTHIAVAFDAGKQTFRHEHYEAYKGTRQETPSELREQFPLVRELLDAFGIRWMEVPGYEADDIIGTVSRFADAADIPTLIVSGDKDILQLVSDNVNAMLTRKGITDVDRYDPAAVYERFQLTPQQIIDLKGLMGDSSDNIPGVPGVGEKTAIKLLSMYPSVEEVLEHIDEAPGAKLQERLRDNRELALLSKRLATIHRDVPVTCTLDDLKYAGYDPHVVRRMFQQLEFKSLVDKITREIDKNGAAATTDGADRGAEGGSAADAAPANPGHPLQSLPVLVIRSKAELENLWGELGDPIGIVPDMDVDDYQTANVLGVAVGSHRKAFYIDLTDLEIGDLTELWTGDAEKIVFDLKALAVLLDAHGQTLHLEDGWFDIMLASYLLNPSDGETRLGDIVERELHAELPVPAPGKPERPQALARLAAALPELHHATVSALSAQELDDLYEKVELPLAFVLARMEALGFYVNAECLKDIGAELQAQLTALRDDIYRLAGTEFNINSPKQLGEILFDKLGLPASKKTKTGYSTSADVLERLAPYHEIVEKILEFRQLGKLQSTYVEGLLKVIRKETGRVHTRFHQALTATGRLSSSEPNLQNIPIRMEEGRKLRKAFEATYDDWVIVSADYSQIELRILAHLSGDEALIDAFRQGMDVHTRTAADVFEVDPGEVTSLMRRQAKAVNFGIVYGISDYGLSQNLNIPRAQAAAFIQNYFEKFPGVRSYMTEIVETARKQGYVTTLLNRRRYLPDLHSKNFNLRSFAERTAMNTPIQGTAADIIKLAMVRIDQALRASELKGRMLLQVHDELIFECPEAEVDELVELVRDNMENALTLNVPLQVDIHHGKTWYEAK
ncbi:DNA polymerase I [Alicyclobacillus cycloheptanicus]|uniref:DNA polymerase I n=1 Tax=Alicyclobacillus cycloheptanicus TaxID=1457 RepID=A0ABT9XM80_9BACL|nr:DNA polymerase I [Alicyclobacillus cycloheptanicus]MDQ0191134.1 DNA polymerase-1 [Alicyclobacillus cycloheptanicus]WDM01875.1 DNA polymerase I [Alicyclobacillus cycloheptanicus]